MAIVAAIVGAAVFIVVVGGVRPLTTGLLVVAGLTGGAVGLALRWARRTGCRAGGGSGSRW